MVDDEKTDPHNVDPSKADSDRNVRIVGLGEAAIALHYLAAMWHKRAPPISRFIRRLAMRFEQRAERLKRGQD